MTSTALGAVPDRRAGAASGVDNARTAGPLSVAAIPGLVGLNGDAPSDPILLGPGFEQAMIVSAIVVATAGLLSFALPPGRSPADANFHRQGIKVHHHPCPVDGGASESVTEEAVGA